MFSSINFKKIQGITTTVLNRLLKILNLAGLRVPSSAFLLRKFEANVLRSRVACETIYRWPTAVDQRQVAYRKIAPVVTQLLNEIGNLKKSQQRFTQQFVRFVDDLRTLHQRFVPSATFSGPWTGSTFYTFTENMDGLYGATDRTRVRVALKLFIDAFR